MEACGTVDELNAALGLARAEQLPGDVDELLHAVQHALFAVGAGLATPDSERRPQFGLEDSHVTRLEEAIDAFDEHLVPLTEFILPGGSRGAAAVHSARTICRRAERRVVSLGEAEHELASLLPIVRYLNRLGDLLFVLARLLNARADHRDEPWDRRS